MCTCTYMLEPGDMPSCPPHMRTYAHAQKSNAHVTCHMHVHMCMHMPHVYMCMCMYMCMHAHAHVHVCVHVWHVHMCGMCICAHVTLVSYVHAVAHMDMHTCVQSCTYFILLLTREVKIQTHPILHSDPDLWGGRSLRTYAPLSVGLVRPRTVTRWSESHSHGLGQLLTNVQVREEVASRCGALGVGVTYTLLSRKRSKPLPHPTGPLWLTNLTARVSDDGAAPARGACAAAPARRRRPRRTGRAST